MSSSAFALTTKTMLKRYYKKLKSSDASKLLKDILDDLQTKKNQDPKFLDMFIQFLYTLDEKDELVNTSRLFKQVTDALVMRLKDLSSASLEELDLEGSLKALKELHLEGSLERLIAQLVGIVWRTSTPRSGTKKNDSNAFLQASSTLALIVTKLPHTCTITEKLMVTKAGQQASCLASLVHESLVIYVPDTEEQIKERQLERKKIAAQELVEYEELEQRLTYLAEADDLIVSLGSDDMRLVERSRDRILNMVSEGLCTLSVDDMNRVNTMQSVLTLAAVEHGNDKIDDLTSKVEQMMQALEALGLPNLDQSGAPLTTPRFKVKEKEEEDNDNNENQIQNYHSRQ